MNMKYIKEVSEDGSVNVRRKEVLMRTLAVGRRSGIEGVSVYRLLPCVDTEYCVDCRYDIEYDFV